MDAYRGSPAAERSMMMPAVLSPDSGMAAKDEALRALIEQKERELGELAEYRICQLEERGRERGYGCNFCLSLPNSGEEALELAKARLSKLTEDFK